MVLPYWDVLYHHYSIILPFWDGLHHLFIVFFWDGLLLVYPQFYEESNVYPRGLRAFFFFFFFGGGHLKTLTNPIEKPPFLAAKQ